MPFTVSGKSPFTTNIYIRKVRAKNPGLSEKGDFPLFFNGFGGFLWRLSGRETGLSAIFFALLPQNYLHHCGFLHFSLEKPPYLGLYPSLFYVQKYLHYALCWYKLLLRGGFSLEIASFLEIDFV
ncbi:MAG: hypothetical protein IJS33_02950 [Firmicutes bacterium]|nr:hypothetical protein [Bacillota bacterium]